MYRPFIFNGAVLGALAVMAGAFGAHGLGPLVPAKYLEVFQTAVRYQFFHVFALLVSGLIYREFANKWIKAAGRCFFWGIILFSGSLYLMVGFEAMHRDIPAFAGPITPLGGLILITGWVCLAAGLARGQKSSPEV